MKYRLKVRKITDNDFNASCQFPDTDLEIFDIQFNALVEDISEITNVISAAASSSEIYIESSLDNDSLLMSLKGLFSKEFCFLRFVDLEQIV